MQYELVRSVDRLHSGDNRGIGGLLPKSIAYVLLQEHLLPPEVPPFLF
jgi:hypothetical protein